MFVGGLRSSLVGVLASVALVVGYAVPAAAEEAPPGSLLDFTVIPAEGLSEILCKWFGVMPRLEAAVWR